MPNIKSAMKRLKQDKVKTMRNRSLKSAMKTHMKKVLKAVELGDKETALKELPVAMKKIDKAAKRNVIHRNNAARKISRLASSVQAMSKDTAES